MQMKNRELKTSQGAGYHLARLGAFADLRQNFPDPLLGPEIDPKGASIGKVFAGDALESRSLEVSAHQLEPGQGLPFLHRHRQNEELYIILEGRGRFLLDGEEVSVQAGDLLRLDPAVVRSWGAEKDSGLTYLCIQARQGSLEAKTAGDAELVPGELPW
jgi:mannose-6-phosphate isomerase-like protein (cupin superfamily)